MERGLGGEVLAKIETSIIAYSQILAQGCVSSKTAR
jgi:hypothetical protein